MKISVEVENREEGRQILAGLGDPEVRAFVRIAGALLPLSERARQRVLRFVADRLEEEEETFVPGPNFDAALAALDRIGEGGGTDG